MKLRILGLAVVLACVAPACAGEDEKGSGSGSNTTMGGGQTTSVEITAADGGEVTIGGATLDIPGGALGEDTTITVATAAPSSSLPASESLKGLVYDFGPDGTEFTTAATLTLPSPGTPGDDEEAVIAWLDEEAGAWQNLPTTVGSDGSLSAEITHFTKFVVRFNGVEQPMGDECALAMCDEDASIVGTWEVTGVCVEGSPSSDPFMGMCPEGVIDAELNVTGSITFADDGTSTKNFVTSSKITFIVPGSCVPNYTDGMVPDSCAALEGDSSVCTGDPTESCTCVQEEAPSTDTATGTWSVSGNTLTITEDGEPSSSTFCVSGDESTVSNVRDDGTVITWIATRQ